MNHLFFACEYSDQVWKTILRWLGINRRPQKWEFEAIWAQQMIKGNRPKSEILGSLLATTVYSICREWHKIQCSRQTSYTDDLWFRY